MSIKNKLIEKLKDQLNIEILSRGLYANFLKKIKDKKINKTISWIRQQEIEHIKIVNDLLDLVGAYKNKVEQVKKESKKNKILEEGNALMLLSPLEEYMHKIIGHIKEIISEKKIVYISYNKIPKYTKKVLKEHGINLSDILFINCSGSKSEEINIEPSNLTQLSIVITEAVDKLKNPFIIVDTLSAFSIYNSNNMIEKFVSSLNDKARQGDYQILWVSIDDEDEKTLNSKISQLVDKVIR